MSLFPHPTFRGERFPALCSRHPMYSEPCPACYHEEEASRTWVFLISDGNKCRIQLPDGRICEEGDRATCEAYLSCNGYVQGLPPKSLEVIDGVSYTRPHGWNCVHQSRTEPMEGG